jgi:hypothetical protein
MAIDAKTHKPFDPNVAPQSDVKPEPAYFIPSPAKADYQGMIAEAGKGWDAGIAALNATLKTYPQPTESVVPNPSGQSQNSNPDDQQGSTSNSSPADPSSPTAPTPTLSSGQVSNITQYQPKVVTKYGGGDVTVSFDNTKNMWVAKWKRPDMNESFVVFESNAGRSLTGADFAEGTLGRKNLDAAVVRYRRENKEVPSLPSTKPSPTARDIVVAGKDGLQLTPESLDERKFVGVPDGRQVLVGRLKNSKHWFVLTPGDEGFKYYQVGEKRPSDDEIRAKILGGGFTKAWGPENSIVSGRFAGSGTIANVPSEKVRIESGSNGLIVASPETLDPASRRYVGLTSGAGYRVLVGSVTGSTGAKVWFALTPKEGGGFQSYQLVPGSGQNGYDRAREMLENGSFSQVWDAAGNVTKFTKR